MSNIHCHTKFLKRIKSKNNENLRGYDSLSPAPPAFHPPKSYSQFLNASSKNIHNDDQDKISSQINKSEIKLDIMKIKRIPAQKEKINIKNVRKRSFKENGFMRRKLINSKMKRNFIPNTKYPPVNSEYKTIKVKVENLFSKLIGAISSSERTVSNYQRDIYHESNSTRLHNYPAKKNSNSSARLTNEISVSSN